LSPSCSATGATVEVTVKKVIDGDTIRVTGLPTGSELVRLIGIDAPETGEGYTARECFGREARQWLSARVPRGSRLRQAFDVEKRDRYGRVLAYAYGPSGGFLYAELVANGYAETMTIPPNVRYAEEFRQLQRHARMVRMGFWATCFEESYAR
jgi:micrococcal nuclease